jgi:hypothetical protein
VTATPPDPNTALWCSTRSRTSPRGSHHYRFHDDTYDAVATPLRHVWPAELDLMARLAGLRLRERAECVVLAVLTPDLLFAI